MNVNIAGKISQARVKSAPNARKGLPAAKA